VSPITVQMNRSDDWMLPTNAGPVPIPTPTESGDELERALRDGR